MKSVGTWLDHLADSVRAPADRRFAYLPRLLHRCRRSDNGIASTPKTLQGMPSTHARHFFLAGLIAINACAGATGQVLRTEAGEDRDRTYVILTDLAKEDPYYEAVSRLQGHRAAVVVPFKAGRLGDVLGSVCQLSPEFVAIVARPHTIDVNFAYDVLEFSTRLDDDPFSDFAYGFITGATAADAVRFVSNIIRAEHMEDRVPLRIFEFGPSNVPQVDDGHPLNWAPAWLQVRVAHNPGRFPRNLGADLISSGIIRLWGHGSPDGVTQGLSYLDVRDIKLSPTVVFAGPCFSAVTARFFEACGCDHDIGARQVKPERSLALSFLSSGALGYFGALAEDFCLSAAQEMEHALTTGLPLGMTAKYTYDSAIMGLGGNPISVARFGAEEGDPGCDTSQRRLRGTASRILLGDPAYRPISRAANAPWTTTLKETPMGLDVVATLQDPRIRSVLVDPFRADLCDCGVRNDRLYLVVELPPGLGGVGRISCDCPTSDLAQAGHGEVQSVEERWLGRHLLHLQVDFRHGTFDRLSTGAQVLFQVTEAGDEGSAAAADPAERLCRVLPEGVVR